MKQLQRLTAAQTAARLSYLVSVKCAQTPDQITGQLQSIDSKQTI